MVDQAAPVLEVNDLAISYGDNMILSSVSLTLESGEFLALIGQNGSGKSTLLRALYGLIPASRGSITWNGRNYDSMHKLKKSGVSYFLQGGLIIPGLTVDEHFRLAVAKTGKTGLVEKIQPVFENFPTLYRLQNKQAVNLSGGERQMLSLALLMLQESRIWLLDEPMSGLSPEMIDTTSAFLDKKNREEGIAMLMVEHNLSATFALASNLLVARDGTISRKYNRSDFKSEGFLDERVYL